MDVEVAHRPGAPGEPAEVRTQPPGDARREHALHLPEQGARLAGRHPEVVQAFGVEVGLDAGRVHLQHRVEVREQALAGGIGTLVRVDLHRGGGRHAAEGRIRSVGSRQHGLGPIGHDPLHVPEPADRPPGETLVAAQRTDREPVWTRAASRSIPPRARSCLHGRGPGRRSACPGSRRRPEGAGRRSGPRAARAAGGGRRRARTRGGPRPAPRRDRRRSRTPGSAAMPHRGAPHAPAPDRRGAGVDRRCRDSARARAAPPASKA